MHSLNMTDFIRLSQLKKIFYYGAVQTEIKFSLQLSWAKRQLSHWEIMKFMQVVNL